MQVVNQRWNGVVARLEIVVGGVAETTAAPTVKVRRESDGNWLATGGGSWGASAATNAMTHGDPTNRPGCYFYAIPSGDLIPGAEGYNLVIEAPAVGSMPGPILQHVRVELVMNDELVLDSNTGGSLGDTLKRTLRLRQNNVRTVYSTFNASDQPLTGEVLIYDGSADLLSDTGPGWAGATGKYEFVATYDASNRLVSYVSVKTL